MKKYYIFIDCQNDFIKGALSTEESKAIIPNLQNRMAELKEEGEWNIIFTRDTHNANYLTTMEGKYLPVEHCLKGTPGWCVIDEIEDVSCVHINKTTFGYLNWDAWIDPEVAVIELAGVCTDICLVSNALILKALYPEAIIAVDTRCCAGTTPENHKAALDTMKMCQIEVY